jgi:hypothetical protein
VVLKFVRYLIAGFRKRIAYELRNEKNISITKIIPQHLPVFLGKGRPQIFFQQVIYKCWKNSRQKKPHILL